MTPGANPCPEHGLFAVGVCLNCGMRPICGECAGRWCPSCRTERATAAAEEATQAAAAEETRRAEELEAFRHQADLDAIPIEMTEPEAFLVLFVTGGSQQQRNSAARTLSAMSVTAFARLALRELQAAKVPTDSNYEQGQLSRALLGLRPSRVPVWRLSSGLSISSRGNWVTSGDSSSDRRFEGPDTATFTRELSNAAKVGPTIGRSPRRGR